MAGASAQETHPLVDGLLGSLKLRCIGPHRGGRVVAVAGDVSDPMTFYFGACAGGVWKTTDGGRYWRNVSDGYFQTAAVGALAVSESDPNVIYAGMGEASIRGNVVHGDGVYKSDDGGMSWRNVGLKDTRHIGKIQIHPGDPDTVYVAALGHAWGPNEERGVFRTVDGGASWEQVLYKSERAGSHDVSMDRNNPRVLYAAIWQAQRYPHTLISGGEECGIWRSFDGGDSWEEITRKPGLPAGVLGKIGVVASPAKAGRVWALVEAEDGAVFRSDDYGETWVRLSEQSLLRTRPWYYMHITADPRDPDTVWVQNYSLWKSIDGGASFSRVPTPHGDDHALWIDPNNPQRMIEGNDGGACVTFNGGESWSSIFNQPTAQLYHVTTDDDFPYRVYGSQQDNTAISIPSATVFGAIHERDWFAPGGGESGYIAIKPDDPDIVIASGPAGRRAYNDIMTHFDRRTGQRWNITVWPELYGWGAGAESLKYRFQWTFPIMFSRHDPNTLYVASNHLHRSTDLGTSFEAISGDLTRNDPDKLEPSGGPVTRDNTGAEVYCTIFALAESPHAPGVLWAGTDDGLVHVSEDGGRHWENVTPPDLPGPEGAPALISIIEPSPHEEGVVYLAATRYKHDDTRPYLYKTADYGQSWQLITNGIPEEPSTSLRTGSFTRVIREDPVRRGLLYAGTESGLYISFDDGENWRRLTSNPSTGSGQAFPVVPIHDLVVKDDDLVVATHGRSFWILDDLSPLRQFSEDLASQPAHLFRPSPKVRMRVYMRRQRDLLPGVNFRGIDTSLASIRETRGPDGKPSATWLDAGENPPQGLVLQYHLRERPEGEVTLRFLGEDGAEIRRFTSADEDSEFPAEAGFNRFEWNLRSLGVPDVDDRFDSWSRSDGPMVTPGVYTAELVVGGETYRQPVEIRKDPRITASDEDLAAQRDMLLEIQDRLGQNNRLINGLAALQDQVEQWMSRSEDAGIVEAGKAVRDEVAALLPKLIDVRIHESQLHPSGLHEKLNALFDSVDSADYAPPQQARDVFQQLSAELDGHIQRVETDLAERVNAFNSAVQGAGLPAVADVQLAEEKD